MDLDAWKMALELAKEIYRLTEKFPKSEMFGLTSQLRRATIGVLANIAEGFSRSAAADKAYKYTVARGECSETYALLTVSVAVGRLKHAETQHVMNLSQNIGKCLTGLIRKFRPNPNPNPNLSCI